MSQFSDDICRQTSLSIRARETDPSIAAADWSALVRIEPRLFKILWPMTATRDSIIPQYTKLSTALVPPLTLSSLPDPHTKCSEDVSDMYTRKLINKLTYPSRPPSAVPGGDPRPRGRCCFHRPGRYHHCCPPVPLSV